MFRVVECHVYVIISLHLQYSLEPCFGKDRKRLFNNHGKRYAYTVGQSPKVSMPPQKPVMIFDGECGFCRFWINRWRRQSGKRIEYIASQQPDVPKRFPEISQSAYDTSVQYVETTGAVYHGAEAVLRSRAEFGKKLLLWMYYQLPGARPMFEASYSFVASNRVGLSKLNRLVFGKYP
jgi:predicted DCC family thiol-disulfide oxidoreductase YuxK